MWAFGGLDTQRVHSVDYFDICILARCLREGIAFFHVMFIRGVARDFSCLINRTIETPY